VAAGPFAEQVAANVKLLFSKPNGVMVQSIFVQLFKEDMARPYCKRRLFRTVFP
jgi:hypothetical protein